MGNNNVESIYWDSCVFIDGLRKTRSRWPQIAELESQAKGGKLAIFTSALTIAEVVRLGTNNELSEPERQQIDSYFRHKFIRVVPVDRIVARQAAEIVRNHRLKPPDAIHVATAIRTECRVFYTYDGDGGDADKLLGKNGTIGSPALPIKRPGEFGQMTLDVSE
ncbi:MAG: type II toxin-antitoxin system VapC family toxin [Phycisphaerales bacterium]|nr:type II toxin-antitoxin system VapC family toxin [Phycisphaerales bacterium]